MDHSANLTKLEAMSSEGPTILVIRLRNESGVWDKSPQSTNVEALKVLPEVGTSNLPIKGKRLASLDDLAPQEGDDDPFGFLTKGLEGILLGKEATSYFVCLGLDEALWNDEIHIYSLAMRLGLLGAAEQLSGRISAIIKAGLGIRSLLFSIENLIRNHASGGSGKKIGMKQLLQAPRAARDKANAKKKELATQRRKRKQEQDKAKKTKKNFTEANDRWLCVI
ncbi:hypothetical protein IFR05_004982 [Cadophora sp. M221]|nr:hypothetical protein IFR05_004982 [Cadophora sp. M221]